MDRRRRLRGEKLRGEQEKLDESSGFAEVTTVKGPTISYNKALLKYSIRVGNIRTLSAGNLALGNCSATLFCKSFEFLPHLESLSLKSITAEGKWFAKLAFGMSERRNIIGRVRRLDVSDSRARAPTKEIYSLATIFKNGCIVMADIEVGHHLSSPERLLIREGMAQCQHTEEVQVVSVRCGSSNLFFDRGIPEHRNHFPHGRLKTDYI